ncbi:Major facilitator superfamily transporter [Mycena chlorophos]|uniref:Major facilitator superfamily transporter n=1 Tax=Mycena chlorophos TaxID=658473 RepID=A0A8H6RX03_MYCCL|nr:Major facilitator superfamily transporter [Mycena chlorophos]
MSTPQPSGETHVLVNLPPATRQNSGTATPAVVGSKDLDASSEPRRKEPEDRFEDGTVVDFDETEDFSEHPRGLKLVLLMVALCLSVFLIALDTTINSTATPRITDEFHSLDDISWYGSVYPLGTAATQLLVGKLFTYLSIKWVFIAAIVIFEAGSALCGAAPSSAAFIIGRAISGVGCAGVFPGAMIILTRRLSNKDPLLSGILIGMFGIASVAGPLLGGVFTSDVSWRWCFYINLPFGAITLFFLVFFFKLPKNAHRKPENIPLRAKIWRFDPIGAFVFVPSIVSLLLALQWGGTQYAWGSPRIIGLFVTFGVLLLIFLAIQVWMGPDATVPVHIFRRRSIWSSVFFGFCLYGAFFLFAFYLPVWFQAIKSDSPIKSGVSTIPVVITLVLGSLISGAVVTATGYYNPWLYLSPVLMSIGAGLISTFKTNTGHARWIGYQVIFGFGVGVGMQQPMIAVQTVLPLEHVPTGTALLMFMQTLGSAIFISVGTNIFETNLVNGIIQNVPIPGLNPKVVASIGATGLGQIIPAQYLPAVLEVYNTALTKAFRVSIYLSAISAIGAGIIEWKSVKGRKDISMAAA